MPSINHRNLGDVQEHEYLTGVILATYPEREETPVAYWDTADVFIEDLSITWHKAPIFYHCTPEDSVVRENGAILSGARGFSENDRVILLCRIQTAKLGEQLVRDAKVIGHEDGIRKCAYNYVIVRASMKELGLLELENPEANLEEYCTVYDIIANRTANIADPDNPGDILSFPCPMEKVKPFMRYVQIMGVPLFEATPQGDNEIQIAGVTPNWREDGQGNHIRGGADPKDWWTSYDVNGNPVQNFFEDLTMALMLDNDGASSGTYQKTMDVIEANKGKVQQWEDRSPSFGTDQREYAVSPPIGDAFVGLSSCVGPNGEPSQKATSQHIQTAYGEDEVWVCAVNSYGGIIVSYCDSMWKFVRLEEIPPNIPIPGLEAAGTKLVNSASIGDAVPGATGMTTSDVSMFLAGMITLAGKGGENSIWSFGVLKRINEGAFHRTIHPAMAGSLALITTPIPEDTQKEPRHLAAVNLRWDKIDAWWRYDNWHNTIDAAYGTFGVDVTWWFRSAAQKWGAEVIYADTPLGSMWLQSPNWKAAVWYMSSISSSMFTARRDQPINQALTWACKHSRTAVVQLYIVQRTSVTLWAENEDIFVRQYVGVDPYTNVPPGPDGGDGVSFVRMPDGSRKHTSEMTDEDFESVLSPLSIIRSPRKNENPDSIPKSLAFTPNRNEIEIMGATDLYGDMMTRHNRRNPVDQERDPEFEKAVADLVADVMDRAPRSFSKIHVDMEIV